MRHYDALKIRGRALAVIAACVCLACDYQREVCGPRVLLPDRWTRVSSDTLRVRGEYEEVRVYLPPGATVDWRTETILLRSGERVALAARLVDARGAVVLLRNSGLSLDAEGPN